MSYKIKDYFLCGTAALAVLAPVSSFAQAERTYQGLEEVIVTAQKRSENLQSVPIQVSAFTEKAIQDAGINNTRDFVALVPNMSFDESFTYLNSFVTVRGISQINNADAPIAIVVDGVPQNNQKQFKMNLFDVERIEVLKGPQGALYGRNASGGAINIVTKQPTNDFEGFINGSYGNGDAWELSGGVSGPIVVDKVLFRVSGYFKQDGGRIENVYLHEHSDYLDHDYGVRGLLKVLASDKLTLDFRVAYSDFQGGGIYDSTVFSGRANDIQPPSEDLMGQTYGNIRDASFKFDWDFGFATLTGITGYTRLKENYQGDLDFSNLINNPGGFLGFLGPVGQGQNLDVEMISQELRLVSAADQRLRWIVGGFYIHTNKDLRTRVFFDIDHQRDQINNPALVFINTFSEEKNNAYAVFGQLDFDISDHLSVQGALRYDRDHRHTIGSSLGVQVLDASAPFDRVEPKVTLTYKFDDERLVYATYSTGFRSGGFNAAGVVPQKFLAETLQNFEAGFKTSWLDRRLILNGAVYYEKVDNFQFFRVDLATGGQALDNINKVDIYGFELEAQAMVADGLQLFGGVGTTHTKIKDWTNHPEWIGNKTPKNTTWKLNLGYQFTFPVTDVINAQMRLDYEHRGKKFWHPDNVAIANPVDLIDFRIGLQTDQWGLFAVGKNLTNARYYNDYNSKLFSGGGNDIGFLAQPRTYGVEGRYKF
ncbi:TonB-dependent receptor [Govanella unica]|uniref:TonB-dependent receptor n=1 Tax=Govanella unica TaxID=2975056 RepID=A0A9X3TZ19_9PROT|nr:TonB-dependent receptor [Govania unica]MDA5194017.1 TonB-dependent receptor [Govania unica]